MNHFYIFTWRPGFSYPVFERTCGNFSSARKWASSYALSGFVAFISTDDLPKRFYY